MTDSTNTKKPIRISLGCGFFQHRARHDDHDINPPLFVLSAEEGLGDVEDTTSNKPRFKRIAKNGQLWLQDREAFKTVGPFASCAEAVAYMDSRLSGY